MEYIFRKKIAIHISLCLLVNVSLSTGQSVSEIVNLILAGECQQAKQALAEMEKNKTRSEDTLLFLHGLLSTEGDSAVFFYKQILDTYPNSQYCDDVLFRLAQMRYAAGLYNSALARFREVVDKYPKSPLIQHSRYWIGLCQTALGNPDPVIDLSHTESTSQSSDGIPDLIESPNETSTIRPETKKESVSSSPQFSVQIGAFSRQNSALLRKSFFEKKGYIVNLRTKIRDGQTLYLVWVGSFSNEKEARSLQEELKTKLNVSGYLVSE